MSCYVENDIYAVINQFKVELTSGRGHVIPDAVLFMPGFDPVAPWQEYFMAQNRSRFGLDFNYPSDGLVLWHVDARINEYGGFLYDNSYAEHKLIKLMQADGLEESFQFMRPPRSNRRT